MKQGGVFKEQREMEEEDEEDEEEVVEAVLSCRLGLHRLFLEVKCGGYLKSKK